MAYIQQTSSSATSVWCRINGLTYNSEQYSGGSPTSFRIRRSGTSTWVYLSAWSGNKYTYAGEISGLSCGNSYTIEGEACWNGTWYSVSSGTANTNACPTPPSAPTNLSATVSGLNVTLYYTLPSDATGVEIDRYWVGGVPDITHYHGSGGSKSYSITVPSYNTSYSWDCRATNNARTSGWSSSHTFTTGNPPAPSTPSSPTLGNRVDGGFKVSWGSVTNATSYTLRVRRGYDSVTTTYTTTSTNYTVTGLQYGVTYHVSVRANNDGGSSSYSSENPVTTAPATPTITAYDVKNNEFSTQYSGLASGNFTEVKVNIYSGEGSWTLVSSATIVPPNTTAKFTGLTQGVTYTIRSWARLYINSTWIESVSNSYDLQSTTSRPANWSWSTVKTSGNDFNLTATEWNNFYSRINEFRVYKGFSSYTFTLASIGSNFTATMFNQAKNAIDAMNATGITDRSAGQDVLASYFNTLRDRLNEL